MNTKSMFVGNTEVVFLIPPKLNQRVTREELKFVATFSASSFPRDYATKIQVFFRQSVRGNNTAPKIAIRDHAVDLASGTIGAVIQLSRERRFEISFGVPKGCKKQDLVAALMVSADGGLEIPELDPGSDGPAFEQDEKNGSGSERIVIEPGTLSHAVLQEISVHKDTSQLTAGSDEHLMVDRGRFTRLLADPQKRGAIQESLRQHARPDGSIENGAVSAVLAVHMDIKAGDLVAPAYTALVSSAHGAPLLEREVTEEGVKCYWLPGRMPKSAISKNGNGVDNKHDGKIVPIQHQNAENESDRLLDECRQGIDAFERLIAIVGHVSASSEEIRNLRIQLAQAIYDRNHSFTELRKAQEEIGGLRATVEGLDKLVSDNSGYERRYREMAGELEAAKAQVAATREENLKLLGKLEGLKRLLGS